jgi:hypothetical protein
MINQVAKFVADPCEAWTALSIRCLAKIDSDLQGNAIPAFCCPHSCFVVDGQG